MAQERQLTGSKPEAFQRKIYAQYSAHFWKILDELCSYFPDHPVNLMPFYHAADCFSLVTAPGKKPCLYSTFPFRAGKLLYRKISPRRTWHAYLKHLGFPIDKQTAPLARKLYDALIPFIGGYPYKSWEDDLRSIQIHCPKVAIELRHCNYCLADGILLLQRQAPHAPWIPALRCSHPKGVPLGLIHRFYTHLIKDLEDVYFPPDLPVYIPPAHVPDQAADFLSALTGCRTSLLDRFAGLFAHVFLSTQAGATVVYAPSGTDSLTSLLRRIFRTHLVPCSKKPYSINQLTHKDLLITLAEEQSVGRKRLVMLRDLPVTQSCRPRANQLLKGRPIAIADDDVPNQHFKNRLHFLCVTSNQQRAETLQKQLKADWIDLSPVTTLSQLPDNLNFNAIGWLCTALSQYSQQLPAPDNKTSKSPPPYDGVTDFLDTGTVQKQGYYCATDKLYDAYVRYYEDRFQAPPPLSKICFGKAVRAYIDAHSPRLGYHKGRLDPDDRRPLWYYTGFRLCNPDDERPVPRRPLNVEREQFAEHLRDIHKRYGQKCIRSHFVK